MYQIGIVSYLPDDITLRQKRINAHQEQLQFLNKVFPNIRIICVYQNYRHEDIPVNISGYYLYEEGIGPAKARNILLNQFYNSEDDYMLLLDDDVFFYDYYDCGKVLDDLCKFNKIDKATLISPTSPMLSPFKQANWENKNIVEDNWMLRRNTSVPGCGALIIGNIKKHLNKEIYYSEDIMPSNHTGYEDVDFLLQFIKERLPVYKCSQLITKTMNLDDSTLFNTREDRVQIHKDNLRITAELYKDIGIYFNGSVVKLDKTELMAEKVLLVPRQVHYTIPENLRYINKKIDTRNTLF